MSVLRPFHYSRAYIVVSLSLYHNVINTCLSTFSSIAQEEQGIVGLTVYRPKPEIFDRSLPHTGLHVQAAALLRLLFKHRLQTRPKHCFGIICCKYPRLSATNRMAAYHGCHLATILFYCCLSRIR